MGAGRRTETVHCGGHSVAAGNEIKVAPQRRLGERNRLGSVIFGCTNATYDECVTNKLFGLPLSHHTYVEHIPVGMPLFLFNYTEKKMHGIFEATSNGQLNINPYAWTGSDVARTRFPAQVRVQLRPDFSRIVSLTESAFRQTLIDSYHSPNHFFFEVDIQQTDRLIKIFERAAGNSYRPSVSKHQAHVGQIATPSKVWGKPTGSLEPDETLKLKKPATMVMSEWGKGAQYFPSSFEDVPQEEVGPHHQQSAWTRQSDNEDHYSSDESEDFQAIHKPAEVPSDVEMRLTLSNEKAEQDKGTQAQEEETRRVFEKLKRITSVPKEVQAQPPLLHQVDAQLDGGMMLSNSSCGSGDWEKLARNGCTQEQDLYSEERDRLSITLSDLDSTVATAVKKHLELYAIASAEMRQDGIELRRLLDNVRVRPEELERRTRIENANAKMALELQSLKLEVVELKRQLGIFKAVFHDKSGSV